LASLAILLYEDDYRIEAEARTDVEGTIHHYGASAGKLAPETIIRYVVDREVGGVRDGGTVA
jgi:hypothetical protein